MKYVKPAIKKVSRLDIGTTGCKQCSKCRG